MVGVPLNYHCDNIVFIFQLDMRIRDNALARTLLEKRQEFLEVKAVKTCEQHASMIDDYSWQLEHEDDIADLLRCENFILQVLIMH